MASTTYINNVEITNGANITSYLIEPTLFQVATTEDSGATYTTANLAGFTLITGATIQVKFGTTNKVNATLNISSTGAKAIWYNNAAIAANTLKVNHIYALTYDGTQWQVNGDIDTWRPIGTGATDAAAGNHGHGNITKDGKMSGSTASGTTTTSHLFLREDGTWAKPAYTTNTNTHRPIKMNGTQILGNNTTALDLVAGSHISLTNNNGVVTIANTLTASDLGLSSALRFVGKTTSTMSESFNGVPAGITNYTTPIVGDVVLDSDNNGEYVCTAVTTVDNITTYTWEWLGAESSFKLVQTAVTDPSASSSTSTTFIDTISQNTQGVITATKKTLPTASTSVAGIIKIGTTANDAAKGNHTHNYLANTNKGSKTQPIYITSNAAATCEYMFPIYYNNLTLSNTAPEPGAYCVNGQTNPVTEVTEYGSVLSLPGIDASTKHYAAQLYISSASGGTSPVHAYIRRLTSTPGWSSWTTLLDNKNVTIPNSVPQLSWNTESTILTVNGNDVKIKAMSKPTYTNTDVGLGNVTNHAQVTSLAFDSTTGILSYKVSEGTAQTITTFGSNAFNSTAYLPLAGGDMSGTINRYYSAAGTPLITLKSKNISTDLFRIGHTASEGAAYSHYYVLRYRGDLNSPNNHLQLLYNGGSDDSEIVRIKEDSTVQFIKTVTADITGNAGSATEIKVTNVASPSSGSKTYYLTFTTSTTTGNQGLNNSARVYIYEEKTKTDLCIGTSSLKGGITIHNGNSKYGYITTDTLTANRTYTLPNAAGTIALTSSNISGTSANITGTLALTNLTAGDINTALMGQGASTAPAYVAVSPSISITDGDASNAPKINLTVLGISGTTAQELTKASISVYGATRLSAAADDNTLAATAKSVYDLDVKVNNLLSVADAMVFKGTLGTSGSITTVPNGSSGQEYSAGDTYKIVTAGTYAGIVCEIGDLLIATADSGSGQTAINNGHWTVAQTNIDGAVTGPISSVDEHIAIFDGTTGKIIKDSGFTIQTSVPENALFTDEKVTATANTATTFYLIGSSSSSTATGTMLKSKDIYYTSSNSSGSRRSELVLGNNKSSSSSGGRYGLLSLYSTGTSGTSLNAAANSTSWYTVTLPAKSGTLVTGATTTTQNAIAIYSDTAATLADSLATIDSSGNITATSFIGALTGNVTGDVTGDLTGNVTGDVTGDLTGNADTATNATNDSDGNPINTTYVKLDGSNNMTGDLSIIAGDTDKFVNFWYNTNRTTGASWRIGMLGSGSSNTNYFVIQSGTSTTSATTWNNTIRIGQNNYDVALSGQLNISYAAGINSANGILNLTSSAAASVVKSGTWQHGINHVVTNLATGGHTCIATGKANETNKSAVICFNYNHASTLTQNTLGLGLFGNNNLLTIDGNGQVKIVKNTASSSTTTGVLVVAGGIGTGAASYLTGPVHIVGAVGSNNSLIARGLQGCTASTGNIGTVTDDNNDANDYTATDWGLYLNHAGGPVHIGSTSNDTLNANTNNLFRVYYTQDASDATNGAVVISGGASIAKKLYVGTGVYTPLISAIHTADASDGIKIYYSTTIDFFMGVGNDNATHGIYDNQAAGGAKWILSADTTNHDWNYDGTITQTANSGNIARPIWFSHYDGTNIILGKPGYNNNFTYNPSTRNVNFTDNATITVSTGKTLGVNTTTGALTVSSTTGALTIQSSTGAIKIQNTSTGGITLSSGNTLFINKPANASIIFTSGGADTSHEKGRFNTNGMFQLATSVTQNTHKLLVNGDSAFNGRLAFVTAVANTLTEAAGIGYNSTDTCINFRIGSSANAATTMKLSSTAFYHATTNTGTLGTSTYKWKELYLEAQSTDNSNGIMFYSSTNLKGRIWTNTSGGIGIYGIDNLYFRTSLTDTTKGMQLSTTNLYPSTNDGIDLGSTTNEWKYTYSKKFIVEQHVTMEWNATDLSLDFIFA